MMGKSKLYAIRANLGSCQTYVADLIMFCDLIPI